MAEREVRCRACMTALPPPAKGRYAICTKCGSLNLVSELDASEDNRRYFDDVYAAKPVQHDSVHGKLFALFERLHNRFFKSQINLFYAEMQNLDQLVQSSESVLEIGFGYGEQLTKWLKEGAEAYGVELSLEALKRFKLRFPEYSDRVFAGFEELGSKRFSVIYSSALLEHLDDPADFLRKCRLLLSKGGALIFRFPALVDGVDKVHLLSTRDINEWDPCHRGLYSKIGIEYLMQCSGLRLVKFIRSDYYGYKVMSALLQKGVREVEYYRHPAISYPGVTTLTSYVLTLCIALTWRLVCAEFIAIMRPDGDRPAVV